MLTAPLDEHYQNDSNILVASWIDDLGYPQKEYDEKILFYNSETILNREDVLEHFKRDNKKLFAERNIEFSCRKGKQNAMNQDSFFCICDGKNKFYGIFDGHGTNGHLASSFAMGAMVDYIKNSKRFKEKSIDRCSPAEVEKMMKKCFRYA